MEGDVSLTSRNLMRENSVWTPENAYRKHLIRDILHIHNNRKENEVKDTLFKAMHSINILSFFLSVKKRVTM